MKTERDLILVFDTIDAENIKNLIKDKKKKILAITPNAFEVLSKNGFQNIVSPYNINENLHEQVAEDNIKLRDKFNSINRNHSFASLCDENFKNIFVQCFASINYFIKFINKDTTYLCFLDNNLKIKNHKEILNLILDTIILKKYGIFKLGFFFNNKKLFLIKKIINNFLFYYIRKKQVIFNFLENKKKVSKSENTIEITFQISSSSRVKNLFQIIKNFLYFFTNSHIKIIYPEIKYQMNPKLENQVRDLLKFLDMDAFKIENKNFIFFLTEIWLYQAALTNFLNKRFNNSNIKYFVSDFLTWMDPNIVAKYLNKKNLNIFLSSHGNLDLIEDPLAHAELLSLGRGLCYSDYATDIVAQSPSAYEISKQLINLKKINIIKSHPIAYRGQRLSQNINQKNINILFAGTYKVFLSRPYIYQGSFQFINTIKKTVEIFKNFKNVNISLNIRNNDEISNSLYKNILEKLPNYKIYFNSDIENLMQKNHLLITNFSTLIDEFSYLNKPVIVLNDFLKYECYKHLYSKKTSKDNLDQIYYMDSKQLENEISYIVKKIRDKVKIEESKHTWKENEAINNEELLNKINQ